ncbi:MAG: flagellar basal body rod protein [Alphaproteobacteria bacterium]|nr:MAG: flagellar basal body rod protein [Alphaproteobacteria bacterium]
MNTGGLDLFNLASLRLRWLSERQGVVTQNIASADVSGYRAKEIEPFESFLEHAVKRPTSESAEVSEAEGAWETDLSGNNVVLEEQMVAAADTAGQYRMVTSLYRKAHELMIAVAGRG